jgi:hypothetical protein
MQPQTDSRAAAERESRLLIGVSVSLGCFMVICILLAVLVVGVALLWTLEGQLGPGGLLPSLTHHAGWLALGA